jgi:hypothetical protein
VASFTHGAAGSDGSATPPTSIAFSCRGVEETEEEGEGREEDGECQKELKSLKSLVKVTKEY